MENNNQEAIEAAIQNLGPALAQSAKVVLSVLGVQLSPVWTIPIVSAFGLYGFYLCYKEDELKRFMSWVRDHPDEFSEYMVQQKAFQDGFIITLEEYLKARTEEKRSMIKSIFLGFASEKGKENFDLERMYEVVRLISQEQVKALRLFRDDKFIDLDPASTLSSQMKSMESLGLVTVEIDVRVENQDEMEGDRESGFHPTGRQVASVDREDWAELTVFGERFMTFCELK